LFPTGSVFFPRHRPIKDLASPSTEVLSQSKSDLKPCVLGEVRSGMVSCSILPCPRLNNALV